MQETIDFRKKRDFGEIFNATTMFIKQEFNVLGKAFLYYVLPITILIGIMSAFNQAALMNSLQPNVGNGLGFRVGSMIGRYFFTYVILIIQQTVLVSFIYGYIKIYMEEGSGNFTAREVSQKMTSSLGRMFLAFLAVFIICMVGTIMCVIPGIYLAISLSVIFGIIMFEELPFGEAFSRSFDLTKNQWWSTFLVVFVSLILSGLITYVLAIPLTIFGFAAGMHSLHNPETFMLHMSPFIMVYTCFMSIVGSAIYIIPHLIIAFQYFNLVEMKERPSLMNKIDQITGDDLPKTE